MVREWGATFLVDKHAKALNLASAAVLLIGTFMIAGPALAQGQDPCPNGQLPTGGTGQDIVINHACTVHLGTYNYGNVNIANGSLVFEEKASVCQRIRFVIGTATSVWARKHL
jgi:hypothetical protein